MSSIIIAHDSRIIMLEFAVNKLCVPTTNPFDAVIMSKYIVSFRFLDDEWIEITPNRLDYRCYRGSQGEAQLFHGGKSLVFSVPADFFKNEFKDQFLEVRARREISEYFEKEEHCRDIGEILVNVDDMLNTIVTEMRLRRELGDYLTLIHERDPISSSMKCTFNLGEVCEDSPTPQIEIYLRFSYLGSSVVTEIEKPCKDPLFYAQEETNLAEDALYVCRELEDWGRPTNKPGPTVWRGKASCICTDEMRCAKRQADFCKKNQEAQADCRAMEDKETSTRPDTDDKCIGSNCGKSKNDGCGPLIPKEKIVCPPPCEEPECCCIELCMIGPDCQPVCVPVCVPVSEPIAVCCYD